MKKLLMMMAFVPTMVWGQSFDFDMTKPQPVYTNDKGAGYDIVPAPGTKAVSKGQKTMVAD